MSRYKRICSCCHSSVATRTLPGGALVCTRCDFVSRTPAKRPAR